MNKAIVLSLSLLVAAPAFARINIKDFMLGDTKQDDKTEHSQAAPSQPKPTQTQPSQAPQAPPPNPFNPQQQGNQYLDQQQGGGFYPQAAPNQDKPSHHNQPSNDSGFGIRY